MSSDSYFDPLDDSRCCRSWFGCAVEKGAVVKYVMAAMCAIAVLLTVVLVPLSVKTVSHSEMGLVWHKVSHKLDDKRVGEGLSLLTPDAELKTFNNKMITRTTDIICLSNDGLQTSMTVSMQFTIDREVLREILLSFANESLLLSTIDLIASNRVKEVCATIDAEAFFIQRAIIDKQIAQELTDVLSTTPSHVIVAFVQLKNIAIQPRFSQAIQRKQVALENVDIVREARSQSLIQDDTKFKEAAEDVKIQLVQAIADANGINFAASEFSESRSRVWAERLSELQIGMQALGLSAEQYLNQYLFPTLQATTLNAQLQVCLDRCIAGNDCWACWVQNGGGVNVAVNSNSGGR